MNDLIDLLSERILELQVELDLLQQKYIHDIDHLTALNRHYLHHFYDGDVLKMLADFEYVRERA